MRPKARHFILGLWPHAATVRLAQTLGTTNQRTTMNIISSGNYAINPQTFGVNFEATVNGQSVVFSASTEALQDIDPSNAHNTAQQQFLANQSSFQAIAEQKIRAGATSPVAITSCDVLA